MQILNLEEARSDEAKRRLRMLGDLIDAELSDDELCNRLREKKKKSLVPAKYLAEWRHTYILHGEPGLRPDWSELDDANEAFVLERYETLGDLAEADTITEIDIALLADQLGWTFRRTRKWLHRYRIGGLWGLARGKNPLARKPRLRRPRDLASREDIDWKSIGRKLEILGPLAHKKTATTEEVRAQAAKFGVCERTVWTYFTEKRKHGIDAFLREPRSDKGKYRGISPRMVEIVKGIRLSYQDYSIRAVHEEAVRVAEGIGEAPPSEHQVRRICKRIRESDRLLADGRHNEFRNKYRVTHGMQFGTSQFVYQMDHTVVDVLVRDLRSARCRTSSGEVRPWLTLCMDSRSRAVVGARFGYDRPSRFTVAATIRDSLLTTESKPCGGVPDELWVDRGKELVAHHVTHLAHELGIELFHGTPGQPQQRGRTERFFGTLNTRLWSRMPGYVASNTTERNPGAKAEMTISELVDAFWTFVEEYHREIHSVTNISPIDYWTEHRCPPPVELRRLDILLMESARRKVGKIGIRYRSRKYWHDALAPLVGESVLVRTEPSYAAPDEIEVFHNGAWVCTAFATDSVRGRRVRPSDVAAAQRMQLQEARQRIGDARKALRDAEGEIEEVEPSSTDSQPSPPSRPVADRAARSYRAQQGHRPPAIIEYIAKLEKGTSSEGETEDD
jgi:putative transposase